MTELPIVVRKGSGTFYLDSIQFSDQVEVIRRIPREHVGWASVRYRNKRYQLFGGVRTPYFICTNNPLKGRNK